MRFIIIRLLHKPHRVFTIFLHDVVTDSLRCSGEAVDYIRQGRRIVMRITVFSVTIRIRFYAVCREVRYGCDDVVIPVPDVADFGIVRLPVFERICSRCVCCEFALLCFAPFQEVSYECFRLGSQFTHSLYTQVKIFPISTFLFLGSVFPGI